MRVLRADRVDQIGMGNTLGFVAMVVGLGAMFGAILEHSGGAGALARYLLGKAGEKRTSSYDRVVAYFAVMGNVSVVHDKIIVPNNGGTLQHGSPMDLCMFSNYITVTYL